MQTLHQHPPTEHPFNTAIPTGPCESFDVWAGHPDLRIADAGAALRAKWCAQADSHLLTAPLMALAKRAWREHWPDGATAGALIYDVAGLARHIKRLESRIAELEGGAHE